MSDSLPARSPSVMPRSGVHAVLLHYLRTVVEEGSIRAAAERLAISASTINRQILRLETLVRTPLFVRTARGLKPTDAGLDIYRHFDETLRQFDLVFAKLESHRGVVSGIVRMAVLDSVAVGLLPDVLARFHTDFLDVRVEVVCDSPAGCVEAVRAGRVDISVGFVPASCHDLEINNPICAPVCVIVSPDHLLSSHRSVTLEECAVHRFLYHSGSRRSEDFFGSAYRVFRNTEPPVLEVNDMVLAREMICRGFFAGLYTRIGFLPELRAGKVVSLLVDDEFMSLSTIAVLVRPALDRTPAVAQVLHALSSMLRAVEREVRPPVR